MKYSSRLMNFPPLRAAVASLTVAFYRWSNRDTHSTEPLPTTASICRITRKIENHLNYS